MCIAPRYISSTETGLILELELILGPLWVLAAFGEVPSKFTVIGGVLLLLVLTAHELAGFRDGRREGRIPPTSREAAAAGAAAKSTRPTYATCAGGVAEAANVQLHEGGGSESGGGGRKD